MNWFRLSRYNVSNLPSSPAPGMSTCSSTKTRRLCLLRGSRVNRSKRYSIYVRATKILPGNTIGRRSSHSTVQWNKSISQLKITMVQLTSSIWQTSLRSSKDWRRMRKSSRNTRESKSRSLRSKPTLCQTSSRGSSAIVTSSWAIDNRTPKYSSRGTETCYKTWILATSSNTRKHSSSWNIPSVIELPLSLQGSLVIVLCLPVWLVPARCIISLDWARDPQLWRHTTAHFNHLSPAPKIYHLLPSYLQLASATTTPWWILKDLLSRVDIAV